MGAKKIEEENNAANLSKDLEKEKEHKEKGFAHTFNIRIASATLNKYAVDFDMHNFKELDRHLNKIVSKN